MSVGFEFEFLKQIGWWLEQLQPQARDLGSACELIRRRLEHPDEQ
jgi:hypothetical protein